METTWLVLKADVCYNVRNKQHNDLNFIESHRVGGNELWNI